MRAVVSTGSIEKPLVAVCVIERLADEPGRLVIEVAAAGIAGTEPRWVTNWRNADGTPREQPVALGLEFAERVHSHGSDVQGFTIAQNVMGILDPYRAGAMAEFVSAEAQHVLAMPAGLSYEAASTLPLSGQTAWQALTRYGRLGSGQRVPIHGGADAVARSRSRSPVGSGPTSSSPQPRPMRPLLEPRRRRGHRPRVSTL